MTNPQATPAQHYAAARARLEAHKAAAPRYRVHRIEPARPARSTPRGRWLRGCASLAGELILVVLCLG